ncbi:MAG: UDP-N-acetylglucosamine 1-carboxyvinyltransferase [Lentisphaerae bacterium]|jgi:UDP-N-acetylglucosamine 1-carboxyvinyltransferase|nr:UDP-N-acetylglucosamine 1-carboxyvinyltransferase [Lentisphaerota bacterium]
MARLIIHGGARLAGVHRAPGNKNAALPMLAAALLTDEPITLENLPLIQDVRTTLDQLARLGVEVDLDEADRSVRLQARQIRKTRLDKALSAKVRSAILFAGPLLARCGAATICQPGGDLIGRRRVDTHLAGLRALGAGFALRDGYVFRSRGLTGADILLDEQSVTATENLVMAAALAKGRTTLYNAACEPHVQDLCRLLNTMGASVQGIGTNRLTIDGVDRLHGATARIGADYIDAGSYLAAALVTGGALTVEGIQPADFAVLAGPFRKFGVKWTLAGGTLTLPGGQRLRTAYDFGDAIPKIEDGPWPAFPSDLMSILIVLATQTRGTTLFFEKMFESRMYFVDHLITMGARIVQCDPHRVVVTGPAPLHGTRVSSPDIRAGIALLIAALAARGETVILNAESIDRGYESVELRLRELGARIERQDP